MPASTPTSGQSERNQILAAVAVYQQIDFMLTRSLGFDKENILVIRRPDVLKEGQEAFKNDLLRNPAGFCGLAICYQVVKAAMENPVESLRSE